MIKRYVMVAGIDYEFKGVDFSIFCKNRIKRIILKNKEKTDLQFTTFDIRGGEVSILNVTYPSGKKKESVSIPNPSKYKSVSKANYKGKNFKNGQTGIISIVDIYKEVQNIGLNHAGTLMELSFFSHAWMGGPILVNSYDDGKYTFEVPFSPVLLPVTIDLPLGSRDPDDLDPRGSKDFLPPNMSAADLTNLQNAFHPNGFTWIWGCSFPKAIHEILHEIERHPKYKSSGLEDNVEFQFRNMKMAQATLIENFSGVVIPDKEDFKIKFGDLKKFICKVSIASYSQILANNTKKNVIGGVLGTYSEYDSGSMPLMQVHKGFTKHFTFYKNYIGFSFDEEGRNYGIYTPNKTCS